MRINSLNNTRPSFGLITLNAAELIKSQELIKSITKPKLSIKERNNFALDLYNVFEPHIKQEGLLKAKGSYIREEVISELKVLFWEFINKIKNTNTLDDLIGQIDEYKPNRELLKPEYSNKSLDKQIPHKDKKYVDEVTEDKLPQPQSEVKINESKQKLISVVQNTKMTKKTKKRLLMSGEGMSNTEIAKKEGLERTTIKYSIKKGILRIQKKHKAVNGENKEHLIQIAKILKADFDKVLDIATKHIQIMLMRPETIEKHIKSTVKLLGVSEKEYIEASLNDGTLLCENPETLNKNAEMCAKLFDVSKTEYIKNILKKPKILAQKPETLNKNAEISAKILGISKKDFIKIALKQPQLLYQKPETLNKNAENSAKLLGMPKEDYIKTCLKRPQLLYQKPETLNKNAKYAAKLLGISKEDYIKTCLKRPELINLNPKTINSNIEKSAKLLGITKEDFSKTALKQPQLFYQKPETLNNIARATSKILGISKSDFVKKALVQQNLFYQNPETVGKKMKIIKFSRRLKKKPLRTSIDGRKILTSEEELYKGVLAYIVKKECRLKPSLESIKKELPELLNSYQSIIKVKLPKSEVTEDFIKFAEEYSIKTTGKNIFDLSVRK